MSLEFVNKKVIPTGEDASQPVTVLTDKETNALITDFLDKIYAATSNKFVSATKYQLDSDSILVLRVTTVTLDSDFQPTASDEDFKIVASGAMAVDFDASTKKITLSTTATRGNILSFDTFDDFPATGEAGFTYVDLATANPYFWNGTAYVKLVPLEPGDEMVTDVGYTQPANTTIMETITFTDPATGDTRTISFTWQGDGLAFVYDDTTKLITVSAAIHHVGYNSDDPPEPYDGGLSGKGTADDPLLLNIHRASDVLFGKGTEEEPLGINLHNSYKTGIDGSGTEAVPLSLNIQHDLTLKGKGTETEKLVVDLEVDGNPIYGNFIYLGIDNQRFAPYIYGGQETGLNGENAGSILAGAIIDRHRFFRVIMTTTATGPTSHPYVAPSLDKEGNNPFIDFIHPGDNGGSGHYELFPDHAVWQEKDVNGVVISTVMLAENGYWIPGRSINGVYKFGQWNADITGDAEDAASLFWPLDTSDPFVYPSFPDTSSQNYAPKLLFNIWSYYSITEHIDEFFIDENGNKQPRTTTLHIDADERTKWNKAVTDIAEVAEDLTEHIEDTDVHIQSGERTKWNGAVSDLDLTNTDGKLYKEQQARIAKDDQLQAQIDSIGDMGRWLGAADTYAELVDQNPWWQPTVGFEPDIDDYATVRADETHSGAVAYYRVTAVAGSSGAWQLTFQFEVAVNMDMSGKMDKIGTPTDGYIPTMDVNGQLTGTQINPDDLALVSALEQHTSNDTIHVTATDKTNWNGKASQSDISTAVDAETSRATGVESGLQNAITALQAQSGYFVGDFATYALVPKTSATIKVGDFAMVISDENKTGATSFYKVISKSGNNLTWDFIVSMPMTEGIETEYFTPALADRGSGLIVRWGKMRQITVSNLGGYNFTSGWHTIKTLDAKDIPAGGVMMFIRGVTLSGSMTGSPSATPVPMFCITPLGLLNLQGTSSLSAYYIGMTATYFVA